MRSSDAMTRDVIAVPAELDLAAAWRLMKRESIRHLPVVRNGVLVGMLSDRDLLLRADVRHGAMHFDKQALVMNAMSVEPITCTPDDRIGSVVRTMIDHRIDSLPVVDERRRLLGLVTSTDLLLLLRDRDDMTVPYSNAVRTMEQPIDDDE